jgi:hypothetical protein
MKQGTTGWVTKEKLSYEGVNTDAPKPLDPGLYKARITNAILRPTKKNDPMIELTCEVFEDGAGNALPFKRKIKDLMVLTQAAAFRILILAKALDIEPLSENDTESTEEWCREIVKAAKEGVWVRVKHEQYTNKNGDDATTMRIGRYLNPSEVQEESVTSKSNGTSNGASEEAPTRRPRRGEVPAQA